MSKKTLADQPADDWAGLAQNLFGIKLEQSAGDEDLLDDDMFKLELPKPPEPPVSIPQSEVEFSPVAEAPIVQPPPPVLAAKPPAKLPQKKMSKTPPMDDEPFGFGVVEDICAPYVEETVECSGISAEAEDDGLTLPEDYDAEGLTLPADYDDGLTLASEGMASDVDLGESTEEDEDEPDTEVLPAVRGDTDGAERSDSRRRRQPRRTREDAYWDMLENWEWEEIPDSDTPRGEGDKTRTTSDDRGGRRGGRRGDRGGRDRGRVERPRPENRSSAGEREVRDERHSADALPASSAGTGDKQRRPERGDRSRGERSSRENRPRTERATESDDRSRVESRQTAVPRNVVSSAASTASVTDDFGSGIFEEQSAPTSHGLENEVAVSQFREEPVAQSSQTADPVLRTERGSPDGVVEDDLAWPSDDSDVRPVADESRVETSILPPADVAGETDEMVSESDVEPLSDDERSFRPRRRRRRRREPRSASRTAPPDGNEGTTFDLSEALSSGGESPDFIPSAAADDSGLSDGFDEEVAVDGPNEALEEGPRSDQRGARRRRRRRRPSEGVAGGAVPGVDREKSAEVRSADRDDENFVVRPITYSNIPSWEDTIKYLLQPSLVGRNLGPEDADEGLENDPRGSGGAEPTPPPPSPRRQGGRGRGRRN